jgi:hypothetical protein
MTTEINNFLNHLPSDWEPIKQQAVKYFDTDSKIREDSAAQIFRQPWIAPEAYGLLLFPPAEKSLFQEFQKKTNRIIPKICQEILLSVNGCFVYGFSLYGLPKSIYATGLLDRGGLQQFDLTTAGVDWIKEYDVDQNLFHFGGRRYSYSENIGYFVDNDKILSMRKNGKTLNSWTTIKDFLASEIKIAEQMMIDKKPA